MDITIDRQNNTPLFIQIKNQIKDKILIQEYVNGFKLPSERTLAKKLGVHRNTVIKAYDELIKENLLYSSVSPRGYFVNYSQKNEFRRIKGFSSKSYPGASDLMLKEEYLQTDSLFNELYYNKNHENDDFISFAADTIHPSLYPIDMLDEILKDIPYDKSVNWYDYLSPQVAPNLIKIIQNLLSERNIHVSTKEIQIVSETYEALQFISKLYLSNNDTIIAEEPISPDILSIFRFMNINVITIPMDENGMETQYLESLIVKYRPKLIYTIPTFHYPTTSVMSLVRRYELLELSYKYDIPIIEEDCDSSIRYESEIVPSLKSIDKMGNVIHIYSFVSSICPGVRIAFIAASEKVISKLSNIMSITRMFVSPLDQHIVSEFINRGYLKKTIENICKVNLKKRNLLCKTIDEISDIAFYYNKPKGGSSLWCSINENINPNTLLTNANKLGVSYMPGNLFYPFRGKGGNYMRICYGNSTEEEITEGIKRLAQAIRNSRQNNY